MTTNNPGEGEYLISRVATYSKCPYPVLNKKYQAYKETKCDPYTAPRTPLPPRQKKKKKLKRTGASADKALTRQRLYIDNLNTL